MPQSPAACSLIMDFLAASGVQALGALLERPQAGPLELHMALVCLDGLTRAAGVAGCEAALGWWMPSSEDADPQQVALTFSSLTPPKPPPPPPKTRGNKKDRSCCLCVPSSSADDERPCGHSAGGAGREQRVAEPVCSSWGRGLT